MQRLLTAAATAVLGLGLLAGCGDAEGSAAGPGDYCADLGAAQDELNSLSGGDVSSLEETLDQLATLRDEAPEAIAADWEVLHDAFERIVGAFRDAGLSAEDIEAIQSGQVPDGVDQQALQDAYAEITELSSDEELTDALEAIRAHAQDECDIELQ